MDRIKLVNYLIQRYGFKSYLEIGCEYNHCFNHIKCESKVGVDPERGGTHRMTSDQFFEVNGGKMTFDMVFIDGLHHCDQVVRDISNSLACLRPGGIIALHDCNPTTEHLQRVPRPTPHTWWNGDVWKAIVFYRQMMSLDIVTGDFDFGCGIIRKLPNTAPLYSDEWYLNLTYEKLEKYRQVWLRLAPFEEIEKWLDMGDRIRQQIQEHINRSAEDNSLPQQESKVSTPTQLPDLDTNPVSRKSSTPTQLPDVKLEETSNKPLKKNVFETSDETFEIVETPDDGGARRFGLNIADLE